MYKVGILTYHTGFNYGASLQAYALQTVIRKLGYDCEIINFETERFLASREMFSRNPRRMKEIIKIISRLPYYSSLKKRQQLFIEYTNTYLKTSQLYRTEEELIRHVSDYECIVCGSDQIWNLSQKDAPAANLIFFLNFPKQQRRISYAASFGKWVKEAPGYEELFLPWIREFDAVSIREVSGVEYLKSRGIECEISLDPTVLLDMQDYDTICAPRLIQERYVLLFSWSCGPDVLKAAKITADKLKLPLYNIVPPPRAVGKGIRRKLDIGPREFLSMIKYAEFIVTDSFHGTAFSTTFERPYVSVVSNRSADPRMKSLLEQLGLENHLCKVSELDILSLINTDYSRVQERKIQLREKSIHYLCCALKAEEGDHADV